MKKRIKAMQGLAIGGLTLGALSSAGASMGGTNLVGSFTQGVGTMMPAVGSMHGVGLSIDAAKGLMPRKKRRR